MDFEVGEWDADTATNKLNETLFYSPKITKKNFKKRKGIADSSPVKKKQKKKGNTESGGVCANSSKQNKERKLRLKKLQLKSEEKNNNKERKISENVSDKSFGIHDNLLPKKSKKNKFKNPNWKKKSTDLESSVLSCPNIAREKKTHSSKTTGNTRNNVVTSTQEKCLPAGIAKKDHKTKKKSKNQNYDKKVVNEIGKTNTSPLKKEISLKEVQIEHAETKSDSGSDSEEINALEFDSEGELEGSDNEETDDNNDFSSSNSETEDINSLLVQIKNIRKDISTVEEDILIQPQFESSSKSKSKIKDSKIKLETKADIESEEIPKKKNKSSKMQEIKKTSETTSKKLPFNVEKLKSVLSQSIHDTSSDKINLVDESRSGSSDAEERTEEKSRKVKKKQIVSSPEITKESNMPSLADRMKQQLNAARFRYLNEQLYTKTGKEALDMMSHDKEAFRVYHEGFQGQVESWPENPVKRVINYIKKRPKSLVVADFGCGDAKVAKSVSNKVHSFDLVALNKHVTVCNIENVPLTSECVDIGVFCLSLMGTSQTKFLMEANRVIKSGGTLLIAEVVSRFEKIGAFLRKMEKLGFTIKLKDLSNKMFVWFEFTKSANCDEETAPEIKLLPCVYKRR